MELQMNPTLLVDRNSCHSVVGNSSSESIPVTLPCSSGVNTNIPNSHLEHEPMSISNHHEQMEITHSGNEVAQEHSCHETKPGIHQSEGVGAEIQNESVIDTNHTYYQEIFNYITGRSFPEDASISYKLLLKKRAKKYSVIEGVLYYGKKRVIMDRQEQLCILERTHVEEENGVHLGVKKMSSLINAECFWRGQYVDIANFVRKCKKCTEFIEPLTSQETSDSDGLADSLKHSKRNQVWQKVEVNLHGPYTKEREENIIIASMVDPISHYITVKVLNNESCVEQLGNFILEAFCRYGFAKCYMGETCKNYVESVKLYLQQKNSSLQNMLRLLDLPPHLVPQDNIFVLSDEIESQYTWVQACLDLFVNHNSLYSEIDLFVYMFKVNSKSQTGSPFLRMFGRQAYSYLEDDKENADVNIPSSKNEIRAVSRRRRLRSSTLQCRHCDEIFTSKISFRIHQRKHTEEAHKRGMLEGQTIGLVAEREKRALRRPLVKHRHLIMKKHDFQELDPKNNMSKSSAVKDTGHAEPSSVMSKLTSQTNNDNKASLMGGVVLPAKSDNSSVCAQLGVNENIVSSVEHYVIDEVVVEKEPSHAIECSVTSTAEIGTVISENVTEIEPEVNQTSLDMFSENGLQEIGECNEEIRTHSFICDMCGDQFPQNTQLVNHLKNIHLRSHQIHRCKQCEATFVSVTGLRMHVQSVHEPSKNYSCTLCDYVGKCTNSLSLHHSRKHKKKFQCAQCNYRSLFKGGLERHIKVVHNFEERLFPCPRCEYRGAKRRHLLEHEKAVHNSDVNKHACPICKKLFKTRVLMKHHILSHTDRQLYSCKGCNYTTRYRQTLHYHIKRVHPGQSVKDLSVVPTESDFQAVINAASQELAVQEQRVAEECLMLSASSANSENSEVLESTEMLLQDSYLPSLCESPNAESELNEFQNDVSESYNSATEPSTQEITVIDGTNLTGDDVCQIAALAHSFITDKHEVLSISSASKQNLQMLTSNNENGDACETQVQVFAPFEDEENNQLMTTLITPQECEITSNDVISESVRHISLQSSIPNIIILPVHSTDISFLSSENDSNALQGSVNNDILCQATFSDIASQQLLESQAHVDVWNQ